MTRRLLFALLLLAVGCRAQSPATANNSNPDVNRRVAQHVRGLIQAPPYINIDVKERKAGSDIEGYDSIVVTLSAGERSQDVNLYISKDNSKLLSVTKVDLTKDPYAEVISKMDLTGRPVRGNKDAKVTVVVYDDYQCPFCSRMHQTILDTLKTYGDRVKVIYKDYPLFEIHPWAGRAAINSQCLAEQSNEAYWEFTDYVHANPATIQGAGQQKRPIEAQLASLDSLTKDIGKKNSVDAAKLDACIQSQPKQKLEASVKEAEALGVSATPAVFVNGMKLEGAVPDAQFRASLDAALKDAGVVASAK